MNTSDIEESTPLVFRSTDTPEVRDNRLPSHQKLAVYCILASTLFERIAFYSLTTSLVITLQSTELLQWDPRHSATALLIFSGTTYILTLTFAVITDAKLGRARTVIIGFLLYLIGYTFVTIVAKGETSLCNFNTIVHLNATSIGEEPCAPAILGTLICIAIGAGALQANIAVFGAEQIQASRTTYRYFDKYIVAVNIGSIIATLVIPPIQNDPKDYFIGYVIAAVALVISAVIFGIGWRYYLRIKPEETVVMKFVPVVINACQSYLKYKRKKRLIARNNANLSRSDLSSASHSLSGEEEEEEEQSVRMDIQPTTFLDYAKAPNNGRFNDRIVDDVKSLRSALVVFSLLIPYWLIYDQTDATFPLQGQHMNWSRDKKYIVSWMSLGDPVTIIIGILILNIFVYKYFDARITARRIITKLVVGMIFALISMCIAGIVEVFRQRQCDGNSENSKLSIYAQLPQTICMGLAELFATVASYEYAYFAASRSAQSLFMSLHFCSVGISSFIGTAYIYIFPTTTFLVDFTCLKEEPWSFFVYFFNLAGLQLLFIIIITILCRMKFQIVKLNSQKIGRTSFFRQSSTETID